MINCIDSANYCCCNITTNEDCHAFFYVVYMPWSGFLKEEKEEEKQKKIIRQLIFKVGTCARKYLQRAARKRKKKTAHVHRSQCIL